MSSWVAFSASRLASEQVDIVVPTRIRLSSKDVPVKSDTSHSLNERCAGSAARTVADGTGEVA